MTCPTMYAFDHEAKIVPVWCGLWSCHHCARKNARAWARRCRKTVSRNEGIAYFWTFTLRGKVKTPAEGYRILPGLWDRLRQRIKRAGVRKWSYCAFVEGHPHRSWIPHFHVISLQKSPVRIKDIAMYSGFGFKAEEKVINSGAASSYCAKYASKQNPATPRSFRRVRASRDWEKRDPYELDPLIVKSRNETTADYLIRVADITGASLQDVADKWFDMVGEKP